MSVVRLNTSRQSNMPDCQSFPPNSAGKQASTSSYVGHYTSVAVSPSFAASSFLTPCPCLDFAAVFFSLVVISRVIDAFRAESAESMWV